MDFIVHSAHARRRRHAEIPARRAHRQAAQRRDRDFVAQPHAVPRKARLRGPRRAGDRGGSRGRRRLALKEAVLGKGAEARLIEFSLWLDGEFVYTLRADGVIVATPTGSTAYAMSAQGPILHPAVPALALVTLNPHTLSARPVSVSDRSVIEISLKHALDARAHFDGLALTDMQEGDRLVLKRSADVVRFVHPPGYRYFATLREKLGWSEVRGKPE